VIFSVGSHNEWGFEMGAFQQVLLCVCVCLSVCVSVCVCLCVYSVGSHKEMGFKMVAFQQVLVQCQKRPSTVSKKT